MSELGTVITEAVRAAAATRDALAVVAAVNCLEPSELAQFFHISLSGDVGTASLAQGLPASPGAATGAIVLTADEAMAAADAGRDVILVKHETTPDDVLGMQSSKGILTVRGGLASHAAVVARGWGLPAVVGAAEIRIDGPSVTIGERVLNVGDVITIDGSSGKVYAGALDKSTSSPPPELETLLAWADAIARGHVQVRTNADTEGDAGHGRELGAQGIGLCRTEHMFLAGDRLPIMRRFILSDDPATDAEALAELESAQTRDFETLLAAMDGLPVTIRLLDPPLHEFLPDLLELTARDAAGELSNEEQHVLVAVRRLHESNPMIGTRGVRLGVVRPGLYEMQVRALCTAAAALFARGQRPHVEIMIPLVIDPEELRIAREWVTDVLEEIGHPELTSTVVTIGAMIETPRAALVAGALAQHADFFSFGTNDLTQMTYAFSRDDVEAKLLPAYQRLGIMSANPFAVLDQDGVGELVRLACEGARHAKPTIKLGACGEHAGDPASVDFLVRLGLDSVSCSPFRVPMARLAVAQSLLACGRVHIGDVELDFGATTGDDASAVDDAPLGETHRIGAPSIAVDEALVLHTLRVRGFVTPDGFVNSLGTYPAEILTQLVADESVRHIEKRNMYALLPAGRERQEALLDAYADEELQLSLAAQYEQFLVLNEQFKQLCTDWQMPHGNPNDHSDPAHDASCIDKLVEMAARTEPVIRGLASALARFERYGDRLAEAARCVVAGQHNRFTGVMCESFHDIWMELHEDLIVLQRINRSQEGSF